MNKTDTMSVYFKVLGAGKAEKQLRELGQKGGLAGGGVRRTVPLDVIANAPRYHVGSVIHQDEQAVITQKGEGIVSRQQMNELIRDKKRKNLGNVYVNVIHKSTGEKVKSEASVSENANGFNVDILVEEFEGKVANNVARNRGPLNGVLNNKFKSNGVMR
ncbi:MAG: hypothetical protein GY793_09255 [Proteobacteria bacterium]|nr:hypothetical protein [Pseudomonadota bacterium]